MTGARKHPYLSFALIMVAVAAIGAASFVLSGAGFSSAGPASGSQMNAAPDWVPPVLVRTTISKTVSSTPSGLTGYVRATGTYRVYAQVTDLTSGVGTVTANVTTLTSGQTSVPMTAGSYTVSGQTYNYASAQLTVGAGVAQGTPAYSIYTVDNNANAKTYTTPTVVVDNTAPSDILADPGNPFRGRTKGFSSTVADTGGSGLDTTLIQTAPTGTGTWTTICTMTTSPWSCTYNTTLLTDAFYDLRSTVTDNAGNSTTSALVANRQLDNAHPGVVLDSPGAQVTGAINLTGSVESGRYNVSNLVVSRSLHNANTWTTICTLPQTTSTTANFTCPFTTTTVSDGNYDFRAVATDTNAATNTAIQTVIIDNQPPGSVQMTNPGTSMRGTVTLSGSAVDSGAGMHDLTFQVAPNASSTWTTACVATSPATSCSYNSTGATDGLYQFRMIATDNSGNSTISGAFTGVRIDNTGPTVTMTAPAALLSGSVALNATVADAGVGLATVKYQRSPTGTGTWTDICTASLTPWSCAWATTGVTDGGYDLRAIATDTLGNATTSATVTNRVVDNTAPTAVTMTDPGSMHGTVTLSGTATDSPGSGIATMVFQRETPGAGAGGWITICTVSPPTSTCSFNTTAVTDGVYDFRMVATDNAGNATASSTWSSRRIDNSPPTGNISNPGAQLSGTVSIQANASDPGSGMASLKVQRSLTGQNTWTDICSNTASTSLNCSFNTTLVPDGVYDIRMLATDNAGNTSVSNASTMLTGIIIDNFGPVVSMVDPGSWLAGSAMVLTANATDAGAGVKNVQIQYKLHSASTWTNCGAADTLTPFTCTLNTTTLVSGSAYDLRAIATDNATTNHSTTSTSLDSRVVDNTAPTATVTVPAGTLSGTVAFSATGADALSGLASVRVQRSLTGAGVWTDICSNTTSPLSCPAVDTTTIPDGRYDFRAFSTDNAGNTGASTLVTNRAIDNTPPSVTMTDPGTPLNGPFTLSSTSSDAGTGVSSVTYEYAVAGSGAWATACTGATTPFSCTLSAGLPDGTYDFRATATDGASRTATSATIASRVVDNFKATDVQIANATGTAGKPDSGDTVTLTTSKAFKPSSILAAWTGTSQAITVRITTASPDTLTFYNSANTTQLPLGTVSLGSTAYITTSGRFAATMVQSGSTIVVTLGALSAGAVATVATNNTSTWTPVATATDVAGTPILTTLATQTGGAKKLF